MSETMTDTQTHYIRGVIEALLFVSEKPVTLEQIRGALPTVSPQEIKNTLYALQNEYENRHSGMTVMEIAGGYQMLSSPAYASYVREFYKTKHKEKLSKPALETLAIIAYKQPVTRLDVELIRGVNSDGVIVHLLNKELIKTVGRKDIPGRPFLYGTTKQFLEYFGLKSLEDLPKLEEFKELQPEYEKTDESGKGEELIPEETITQSSLEQVKQSGIRQASLTQDPQEETAPASGGTDNESNASAQEN